jgi:hypothetical protein
MTKPAEKPAKPVEKPKKDDEASTQRIGGNGKTKN